RSPTPPWPPVPPSSCAACGGARPCASWNPRWSRGRRWGGGPGRRPPPPGPAPARRPAHLASLLQSAAETVLFYHPAVWWVSHRMRVERELCCDDAAVAACGNPIEHARALAGLESLRAAPLLAPAATGGPLFERI